MTDDTPKPAKRTALYRLYDANDALLYVGISYAVPRRNGDHAKAQPWWPEVQRQTADWYDTRADADEAEKIAIKAERPKYNITHAVRSQPPTPVEDSAHPDPRRRVGFVASAPCDGGWWSYVLEGPQIIAPGTYLITLGYDPDADEPIGISQCVLVDDGDEVSREIGGSHRKPGPIIPGEPNDPGCRCRQCAA